MGGSAWWGGEGRTSTGLMVASVWTRRLSNAAGFFSISFAFTSSSSSRWSSLLWQSAHEHSLGSQRMPALKHSQ